MKFKEVRTLESVLLEYGLKPGAPTPVGSQTSGAVAKTTAPTNPVQQKTDVKKDLGSPTVTPGLEIPEPEEQQPQTFKAKDLSDGDDYVDKDGKPAGKVISQVGAGSQPDKVVVQDPKGEYKLIEPDDDVQILNASKLSKLSKSTASSFNLRKQTSKKKNKLKKIKKRMKKLVRKFKLRESDPMLFEINYNTKEVVKQAMDLPIKCGFEAETLWSGLSNTSNDDIDNLSWGEVEDNIYISNRDAEGVYEDFREWLFQEKVDEFLPDLVDNWIEENRENEDFLNDFLDSSNGPSSEAIEIYKKNFEETDPKEYENREEDGWEYMNWCREYVEEEYEDEYVDWLHEIARDDGDLDSMAFEEAEENYTIDEWISENYSYMSSFLEDYGIDYSEYSEGDLTEVAKWVEEWADNNSFQTGYVETGAYGTTETDGWAVEDDSSIEGNGAGAEIISPVFSSPREMLEEMRDMFRALAVEGTETNHSTGLHVTMSWNGEIGGYDGVNNAEANKLKMATLLGDEYLLDQFGRRNNSYTKSQQRNVSKAAERLSDGDLKNMEKMEDELSKGIDSGKFNTIHFKEIKDSSSGNNLIEFRIGGGDDYHIESNFNKVVKAVVRYATVMEAGYTDKYETDYAKAIARTVVKAGKVDPKDIESAKDRFDLDNINSPLVDLFKEMLSKKNYFDGLHEVTLALKSMDMYERYSKPDADKKWKQEIADYEKATGSKVEIEETLRGHLKPNSKPPSKRADEAQQNARRNYAKALGRLAVDVQQGKHRKPINSKTISIIRNSLKTFDITEDSITNLITSNLDRINIPTRNDRVDQKFAVIKQGIDKLFYKEILQKPTFLRSPDVEKIVTGLWNAVHSASQEELKEIGNLLTNVTLKDSDSKEDNLNNGLYAWQTVQQKREFNDFYSALTRGGYNASYVLLQQGDSYNKEVYNELYNRIKNYPKYDQPVSPSHSTTIHSDDSYLENWLNQYTMKLRKRFTYLEDIKDTDLQLYLDSIKELGKITKPLVQATDKLEKENFRKEVLDNIDTDNFERSNDNQYAEDGRHYLAFSDYSSEKLQDLIDQIENNQFQDPFGDNASVYMAERLSDQLRDCLHHYYRMKNDAKNGQMSSEIIEIPKVKELLELRFNAIKNWMTSFDKIAQKMGFDTQADEIADKRNIDKRADDFKTNVRDNNRPVLQLPSHSFAYIRKDFYERITSDNGNYALANKQAFSTNLNKGSDIIVVAAAHWTQAEEAINTMQLLNSLADYPLGSSQEWRREGTKKIAKAFYKQYGISPFDLPIFGQTSDYITIGADEMQKLKQSNIGVETGVGDSREPNVQPLVPKEELQNSNSKEPFDRHNATMWAVNNHSGNEAEIKRFNAHDWSEWSDKNKQWIYDFMIKNDISFHKAYEKFWEQNGAEVSPTNDKSDSSDKQVEPSLDNYEEVRKNYPLFDTMMRDGIQNFMPSDEVNTLVSLLSGDVVFPGTKNMILQAFYNSKPNGGTTLDQARAEARNRLANAPSNPELESVFNKFDSLPLQEQLDIISKVNKNKIDKLHETLEASNVIKNKFAMKQAQKGKDKYRKTDIEIPTRDGEPYDKFDYKETESGANAHIIGIVGNKGYKISTAPLQLAKTLVDMYNRGGFTDTDIQQLDPSDVFKESVPDFNKIKTLNKLLADHFPVSDLKKQMLAYEAIPIPQMLTDFRGLRAQAGDDACARGVVRHYINALTKEEQKHINLNEWSKQHIRTLLKEAPMEMQKELMQLAIQVADLERDVQSKCANPKLAKQCNYASKKLDDYKQKLAVVQDRMLQYTATEKDIDTAIQMGREETLGAIRNYQSTVDKLLNKLSDKISGGFDYITFSDSGIEQAKEDTNGKKLTVKDKKKQESEVKSVEQIKQALIGYFKDPELFSDNPEFSRDEILEFLTAAANGEILSMEDIMTIGTDPNLPEMVTFTEVVQTAAERHGNQKYIGIYNKLVDDGLMYQTVANTTSGNVGPGELALLLLAAPAEKGARGDLSVAGREVEIKSGSYSVGDSKTTAGGKFNSDFIVKGNLAGGTLNKLLTAFFKEKLSKDFKKEWKAFMAKQEKPNTIVRYKLEPARMNLPAISKDSFEYVYNPFFNEQQISRDQFRTLARIFSQATFSGEARLKNGHFYEVVTSLSELYGVKGWYSKQIEEIATSKGINESLLKRLIIALQFQSYYINKGHDQILYINKTNQKLTNVTNAKDLIDKFDRGIVVAVKDINLTDTQQTAAHSITAGL
jgi:hypothetical protein